MFTEVSDRYVDEGTTTTIAVLATDADGDALTLDASELPDFIATEELGDGAWQLNVTPGFDDSGAYALNLSVTDESAATDDLSFSLTVENSNRPPSLMPQDDVAVSEGQPQRIVLTADDPDGDLMSFSATALPAFVALIDNGDGSADLDLQPGYFASGVYPLSIEVADNGGLTDTAEFVITVTDVNRIPMLTPLADVAIAEAEVLQLPLKAIDPDGGNIMLALAGAPGFISVIDAGDGTGNLILAPGYFDNGSYIATVRATDDGGLIDEASFAIGVSNVNRPPELSVTGAVDLAEDETLIVPITAADPDNDAISLAASGLPGFAALTDNGDGTGSLELQPDYFDSGVYALTLSASDGSGESVEATIPLTVTDVNRAPTFAGIADQALSEGESLLVTLSASDPDSDELEFSEVDLPAFASLLDNGDGTGSLELQPNFQDSGTFAVTLQVSDTSSAVDEASFLVTVSEINRPPALSDIANPVLAEGAQQVVAFDASDPDNDDIAFEADALPAFVSLEDYGDGNAALRVAPQVLDAGVYSFVVRAVDSGAPNLTDERTVQVTVNLDGSNHVARENSLPGTDEWHLDD
ncbi:MAG TPA: tandem-95 repeat protein, partial [Gammaproteobacteria bacterium]|nr:tandem-95 repeat protein [Gammaproteobacteria bacterium]